ncbi:HIT domain-containing protein [Candidatus Roizmanbacteria bacterium]|nr:HIT domain-containing protein [Candidatus Roizmanbacteria bacterium]
MKNCIFCKIIKGELPSYKVYDDKDFLAFLDIFPRTVGHTLVIPKKHFQWVYDYPAFGKYWETVLIITKAIQKALKPSFVTYLTIGIEVPHAHIHILPRFGALDGVYPEVKKLSKEQLTITANKIYKEMQK